ncbi:MAG: tetratricopeptide repeat protein, partial [Bacteroidota bacterium]
LKNESFDDAISSFEYYVNNYPEGNQYINARRNIIKTRENKIKVVYPVDMSAIRQLTYDYKNLMNELGINDQTIEAYRSKAILHAFYLSELDSAISILDQIIAKPRVPRTTRAQSKIDLGDIYLLMGEHWESTLLYSQVEKANKSSKLGYEAKLRNARLNYYMGNFELAGSHLDILKLATTREIANDALALNLLITDNTALDSSDFVMREYANVDLLMFQNKTDSSRHMYELMLEKYPGHSLIDEIHWQLANIYLKLGNFEHALSNLKIISSDHAEDILGDDATFLMAEIYDRHLQDENTAMQLYRDFLTAYPGSVFVAEARKRFRLLRGDQIF